MLQNELLFRHQHKDEKEYQKYLEQVDEIFIKGKYLAVDDNPMVIEGSWNYTRSVIIEFPNETDFNKCYYSHHYQSILKYHLTSAECNGIRAKGNC